MPTPRPPVGTETLVVLGLSTVKVAEAAAERWSPPVEVAAAETVATTLAPAGSAALGVRTRTVSSSAQ